MLCSYLFKNVLFASIFGLGQIMLFYFTSGDNVTTNNEPAAKQLCDAKSQILKDIEEMKQELELKKLKSEYKELYNQLHDDE